ncbi:MAG: leucine-rich repeat domain-containing protein [Promethearchaeota archaeon]
MKYNSLRLLIEKFHSSKINRPLLISQLLEILETGEDVEARLESISILDTLKVKNEQYYNTLENLLISESNWEIRKAAATSLKSNFPNTCYEPLKWALFHDDVPLSLKTIFTYLIEIIKEKARHESSEVRKFLINEINQINIKEFKIGLEELCTKTSLNRIELKELKEIIINYFTYVYLRNIYWRLKIKVESCKITELDFIFKGLKRVPDAIQHLTSLKKLVLRYNQLEEIPNWLGTLHSLTVLNLNVNNIMYLPRSIGELKNLEELSLWKNELNLIPSSLGSLHSLKNLNLRLNKLIELPDSICNLKSLIFLNLHDNKLKALPDSIGNLSSLKMLNLSWNELISLPDSIGALKSLEILDLERNQLTFLPDSIGSLKSLEVLNLKDNKIKRLPKTIKNLKSLKTLNLTRNELAEVPEFLSELASLEELYLGENHVLELPSSLKRLEKHRQEKLKIYW